MNIEEKRQNIYAQLLRYAPEAGSLRDRILDQLILAGLLDTSEDRPLKVSTIQSKIRFEHSSQGIRTEVIQEALDRLCAEEKVGHTLHHKQNVYFIKASGVAEIDRAAETASDLFQPVLARMLMNTSSVCTEEEGTAVCRKFISECFARFGQQIAKLVTGELTDKQLEETIDAGLAFQEAIAGFNLSADAMESLRARCLTFLRSKEPEDEKLKFRLTQGYYVAQLLGLDSAPFNPIANEAFRGAILYIDSNVLIESLLSSSERSRFHEVVSIANRIGVEIRVTRATIDEINRVTITRLDDLNTIVETIPEEMAEKTRDDILRAFLDARQEDPDLTPRDFLNRFNEISSFLEQLGVTIVEHTADEIIRDTDVSRECEVINQAAVETRGWGKSEDVRRHDVAHYLAVHQERSCGRCAWFLTNDRTLARAEVGLAKKGLPFSLRLIVFLQAISPFVESSNDEVSLAALFSAALEGELHTLPNGKLFDLRELKIIAELHTDVLTTEPEQLLLAFDYVKSNVLDGKQYDRSNHTKVALELKKFLSSSADEKQKALQDEIHRQQKNAAAEREKREQAEEDANKQRANRQRESEEATARELCLEREIKEARARDSARDRQEGMVRILVLLLGAFIAFVGWGYHSELSQYIIRQQPTFDTWLDMVSFAIRFCASLLFVITALPAACWQRKRVREAALIIIVALAIGGLGLNDTQWISNWSGYLTLASPVVCLLLVLTDPRRKAEE